MKTKTNEVKQTIQPETFLRIFDNVKRCKALDWEERVILSNHISYQIHNKEFYQTDSFQSKELGLSPAQISKYTGRLKERELIETKMDYVPNPNGGRPIPKRYVKVIDMDKWVKGNVVPVVKAIVSLTKKKQAKKLIELTKTETVSNANATNVIADIPIAEVKPTTKQNKAIAKDKTLEEMLHEAELKTNPTTKNTHANGTGEIIIDAYKDVSQDNNTAKLIIKKIDIGEKVEFIMVKVKFEDGDLLPDEATLLPNGKYFLKSNLDSYKKTMIA